jgi:hypothetical protein
MTYGSPLSQLHARYFPALFGRSDYDELSKVLYGGNQKGPRAVSWRNFYRLTDPIGKEINFDRVEDRAAPPNDSRNVIVKDPCEDKLVAPSDQWSVGRLSRSDAGSLRPAGGPLPTTTTRRLSRITCRT